MIVIARIIEKVIKEDLEKLPIWIKATNRYAKKIFDLDKKNKIIMVIMPYQVLFVKFFIILLKKISIKLFYMSMEVKRIN